MGEAFVALKRGRLALPPATTYPIRHLGGQGGFEGASPQRAEEEEGISGGRWAGEQPTENPAQPPASFECNPSDRGGGRAKRQVGGWASRKRLGRLSALLAPYSPTRGMRVTRALKYGPIASSKGLSHFISGPLVARPISNSTGLRRTTICNR